MHLLLSSYPKTVPSNYKVQGMTLVDPLAETPGGTLDAAAWDKAKRQADPNYDWYSYQKAVKNALFDHPELAHKEHEESLLEEWNSILCELEPLVVYKGTGGKL